MAAGFLTNSGLNTLTMVQVEALHCLQEELAEAIQAVAKVLRHGYASHDPTEGEGRLNNKEKLEQEMGDVLFWMLYLTKNSDLSISEITQWKDTKEARTRPYLHFIQFPEITP